MIVKLYAVHDTASGVYDGPVPSGADGVAMRNFTNMARDPNTPIGKNPECFSLWRVGTWNDATGEVVPGEPELLAKAIEVIQIDEEIN